MLVGDVGQTKIKVICFQSLYTQNTPDNQCETRRGSGIIHAPSTLWVTTLISNTLLRIKHIAQTASLKLNIWPSSKQSRPIPDGHLRFRNLAFRFDSFT